MQSKELREIFQRVIQHTLTAGALLGSLSCASDKDPTSPTAMPSSTGVSASAPVSAPASTPTTLAQSLPAPVEDAPLPARGEKFSKSYPAPMSGYERYQCRAGELKTLTGITPAKAPDYMQLISYGDTVGEECKTAKNATKCQDALKKARAKNTYNTLLVTQGDEVLVVDKKNVKKFLGVADSAQEAALIVHLNGIDVCSEGATIKSDMSAGYSFVINARSCSSDLNATVEVSLSGDYKLIDAEPEHPCRGRRPEGLCEPERAPVTSAGEFFAEAAWQEAVSVPAFQSLARDLRALNAPDSLIDAALSSAEDETRHARQMTALAARFGAAVRIPEVRETSPKTLLALALENEREGCINETFAALLAWYQAEAATDAEIRDELRAIAEDETRHSQLSFEIRAWALSRLAPDERLLIQETRQRTIAQLRGMIEVLPDDAAALVGWPSPERSLLLLEQLEQNLWS